MVEVGVTAAPEKAANERERKLLEWTLRKIDGDLRSRESDRQTFTGTRIRVKGYAGIGARPV